MSEVEKALEEIAEEVAAEDSGQFKSSGNEKQRSREFGQWNEEEENAKPKQKK